MSDEPQQQGIDRRKFLTVLGVSGAGAVALSGCSTDQVEKLIPYLVQSEDQVPGIPTYYASTCTECATGCGLHVKTREARAIKLEGNPEHPVNAGTLCARGHAGLQGLYNPGRLRGPVSKDGAGAFQEILWNEGVDRLAAKLRESGGKIAVISGAGPGTFSDLLAAWTTTLGGRLVRYEPFDHEAMRAANKQIFGVDQLPAHDFAKAKHIVSFGADFLETWLAPVENQRGFARSHGFDGRDMAKHVYIGPRMSLTGMNADQWLAPKPGTEACVALAMANLIAVARPGVDASLKTALAPYTADKAATEAGLNAVDIKKLAEEFAAARPSLAVAGGIGSQHRGAIELCAAVNILNFVAGNVGETVRFGARLASGDGYGAIEDLVKAMAAGQIAVLIVHEANPAYALPASAKFAEAMAKVPFKVSTSLVMDETASACDMLLPNHHALERWDDLRPRAGVHGLMQPVMEPVFNTVPTGDLLLRVSKRVGGALAKFDAGTFEAHLKSTWAAIARERKAPDADGFWRSALQHGGLYDPTPINEPVHLAATAAQLSYTPPRFDGDGEYVFTPYASSMLYDGRGANRPWLLENPDPVTKITWQSWVELHPDTAKDLDVREGEVVRVASPHGEIEAPAYLYAGTRKDTVGMPLGLGHTAYGEYAHRRGVNALDLLSAADGKGFLPYTSTRVKVFKTARYTKLAKTEGTPRQLGRGIVEAMPLSLAKKGLTPEQAAEEQGHKSRGEENTALEREAVKGFRQDQLEARKLGAYAQDNPQWGMVIDLAKCTGCSACVTACYSENNIPFVGEDQVVRGREMSWMRIERYFEGDAERGELETRFLPMLCQHCDNAPCEPVCPVYASYHTPDGLNGQVYNRCVGTRYCSNNCPYKVRYFNWYAYSKKAFPEPLNLQLNPDVTVRARGVMEKCTFCIQRIRGAQNQARLEDRSLRDGDVQTACAQSCPSGAIVFGNVRDAESRVVKAGADPRGYHVLEDLNVRPAVTYLAKVNFRSEA